MVGFGQLLLWSLVSMEATSKDNLDLIRVHFMVTCRHFFIDTKLTDFLINFLLIGFANVHSSMLSEIIGGLRSR
jgi:hypothetical protein